MIDIWWVPIIAAFFGGAILGALVMMLACLAAQIDDKQGQR